MKLIKKKRVITPDTHLNSRLVAPTGEGGARVTYRFTVGTSYLEEARTRFVSLFIMLLESAFTRVTVQSAVATAINWNTSFLSWLLCTYIARRAVVNYQEYRGGTRLITIFIILPPSSLLPPPPSPPPWWWEITDHATTTVFGVGREIQDGFSRQNLLNLRSITFYSMPSPLFFLPAS